MSSLSSKWHSFVHPTPQFSQQRSWKTFYTDPPLKTSKLFVSILLSKCGHLVLRNEPLQFAILGKISCQLDMKLQSQYDRKFPEMSLDFPKGVSLRRALPVVVLQTSLYSVTLNSLRTPGLWASRLTLIISFLIDSTCHCLMNQGEETVRYASFSCRWIKMSSHILTPQWLIHDHLPLVFPSSKP